MPLASVAAFTAVSPSVESDLEVEMENRVFGAVDPLSDTDEIPGCTDADATNFDSLATDDDV